jgi:hypothetical protein
MTALMMLVLRDNIESTLAKIGGKRSSLIQYGRRKQSFGFVCFFIDDASGGCGGGRTGET